MRRGKIVFAGLILTLSGAVASAQDKVQTPIPGDMYCSGVITSESTSRDTYLITGEESNYKTTFTEGDYVYINKGSAQGVKVGDEFRVIRAVSDPYYVEWTKWQDAITRKIGTVWEDEGRLRIVVTQAHVSIAQIESSCDYMQRGDIVLPFVEREAPPLKSEANFDRFAPPSGKPTAMVVTGKKFHQASGANDIVYVNLGGKQGVKVGDYFRIFRYQGTEHEAIYQIRRIGFEVYGYGSVPLKYNWSNVPREVLGEGIVVRTAPNSSTVLITLGLRTILSGDYVELE